MGDKKELCKWKRDDYARELPLLKRIVAGQGRDGDLELLRSAAGQIEGHTICAFGEAAAWPVQGFLRHYWHEFEYYVEHGRSMVDGQEGKAA